MLDIDWEWRSLTDTEVGISFVISPFFGSLHAFPMNSPGHSKYPIWTKLIGCSRKPYEDDLKKSFAIIPPTEKQTWYQSDKATRHWIRSTRNQLDRWPLILVINNIERNLPNRTNSHKELSISEASQLTQEALQAWPFSRDPECLPRALYRYRWLRLRAAIPELVLGVHVPTDKMHAWVELNGAVLGEEPDEMLCYESSVRYFARREAL